jgi:ABC-type uncharacterized transport system substrate-binding protein
MVVDGTVGTRPAKRVTSSIPIVMVLVGDLVGSGLVANLAHPGGKVQTNKGDRLIALGTGRENCR